LKDYLYGAQLTGNGNFSDGSPDKHLQCKFSILICSILGATSSSYPDDSGDCPSHIKIHWTRAWYWLPGYFHLAFSLPNIKAKTLRCSGRHSSRRFSHTTACLRQTSCAHAFRL